ncbi:hypothetical protein [Taibaiella koreensis]|uniref:hypothetical protein n=1 Tax=Taibaiella koreensis TaxID=1268548 RepID=UPI000E59930A|nr:hypothetical protein [Taibaiella koreensis]
MNRFSLSFCDPFLPDIVHYGEKEPALVIPLYHTIPWLALNEAIYSRHDDVLHDFWFFEISYQDAGGLTHTLNISPEYVTGAQSPEALRFTLRYIRPRMRKRLFGGEKLDKAFLSEREDAGELDVIACIAAFMDKDEAFLDHYIAAL